VDNIISPKGLSRAEGIIFFHGCPSVFAGRFRFILSVGKASLKGLLPEM
jgi:hypothetical protein